MSEPVVIVEVAKAIEGMVRNSRFAGDPVTERSYGDWDLDLSEGDFEIDDATRLHIDVVSHRTDTENTLVARGRMQFSVPVDIAVRQKLQQTEQDASSGRINVEDVDRLMGITQSVVLAFTPVDEGTALKGFEDAKWSSTNIVVAPHQHLREIRQFTGIVRVTHVVDMVYHGA